MEIILATIEEYGYFNYIELKSVKESQNFYYKIKKLTQKNQYSYNELLSFSCTFPKYKFNYFRTKLLSIMRIVIKK